MARSDLLITLIRAGTEGDQDLFRRTAETIIADEKAKKHIVLANRLSASLATVPRRALGSGLRPGNGADQGREFLLQVEPRRRMEELLLPESVQQAACELLEEQHRRAILHDYNLSPRHRVLLAGPPGNGKTTLAEAIAYELAVPLFIVRYDALIGSFLGETGARLRRLFDYVRLEPCVLFFDEFDAVGKERGDTHETGEIKRVVSTLLMQMDRLPDYVVTVTASNHPELLDRAVWRRFQLRLELPAPSQRDIVRYLRSMAERLGLDLGLPLDHVARALQGSSFAEVEEFVMDTRRRYVLSLPNATVDDILRSRLEQWSARYALKRASGDAPEPAPSFVSPARSRRKKEAQT